MLAPGTERSSGRAVSLPNLLRLGSHVGKRTNAATGVRSAARAFVAEKTAKRIVAP